MTSIQTSDTRSKRTRRGPRTMEFTELGLKRLNVRTALAEASKETGAQTGKSQLQIWDTGTNGQRGLSVLLSSGGTKTFLVTFYLKGRPITAKLGRVGEMPLQEARTLTAEYRAKAQRGIDPRPLKQRRRANMNGQEAEAEQEAALRNLYRYVVADFIELYAKPRHRSWDATQRILTKNCAAWLDLDITSIGKKDALALLDKLVAEGYGPKAKVTLAWLRKFWRWCWERDIVSVPLMDAVKVDYAKRTRSRVYNDAEIKAIWKATDQLSPIDGSYIKLLLLLAPRKTALALMRRSDLDNADAPMLWTTPFEYTKSRKTTSKPKPHKTPLPLFAQRILKPLLKSDGDRVFPSLSVRSTRSGREWFDGNRLVRHLAKHGAPGNFNFHACRHTLATWLQTKGHSEWECGLVLNHAASGSVTAGYSHGYPVELKLKLLSEWAEHIENLVEPAKAEGIIGPGEAVAESTVTRYWETRTL